MLSVPVEVLPVKLLRALSLVALAVLVASACGTTASTTATNTAGRPGATSPASAASAATPTPGGLVNLPLVDARTGATFTLAESQGKPLYVENFATWCSNCRQQLGNVQTAAKASGQQATFVALSVETDLSADKVAAYAKDQGFDNIRFAVMTPEVLSAMQATYGTSALNPPSTPHFYVNADGQAGPLATGFEDAARIQSALTDAGRN